jgi:hypothetical protein
MYAKELRKSDIIKSPQEKKYVCNQTGRGVLQIECVTNLGKKNNIQQLSWE